MTTIPLSIGGVTYKLQCSRVIFLMRQWKVNKAFSSNSFYSCQGLEYERFLNVVVFGQKHELWEAPSHTGRPWILKQDKASG